MILGGAGNDRLVAGMFFTDGPDPFAVRGDILTGGTGADQFEIRSAVTENAASELGFNGSGLFGWLTAARITDFQTGTDDFVFLASLVGNGDTVLDGAVVLTGPGGFAPSAELVILRTDVAFVTGDLRGQDAEKVVNVIGSATGILATGQTALMVVDTGTSSAVFLFQSVNGDAAVTADELYMLAVIENSPALATTDFALSTFV